jgi:hypothetical protein
MTPIELLKWQWDGYPRYHQSRANLLLHIVLVPLFLIGNVSLVVGLVRTSVLPAGIGLVVMAASMALQGVGHRAEANPPQPFTSRGNAVGRIFLEQWVNFPRFVLSGKWWRAFADPVP